MLQKGDSFCEVVSFIGSSHWKRVHEFSMIEDQKYMLTQILQAVMREKPDGVLISGDVYDRTIPTAEAVQVLDAFLTSLSEQEVPVFIISGNHDSAERLAFGSNLMGKSGIYLSKVYDGRIEKFALQDAYGTVWIHLLPFLRPSTVRHALPERAEEIQSTADGVRAALEQTQIDPGERNILLAHQFVTGALRCEAEELQVGDVDQIPVELLMRLITWRSAISIVRRRLAARPCATVVHHSNIRFPRLDRRSRLPL